MVNLSCTPTTLHELSKAGWSPDREVDISSIVKDLCFYGFTDHSTATSILSSFYPLSWNPIPTKNWLGSLSFNPLEILYYHKQGDVEYIERLGESRSCLIACGEDIAVYSLEKAPVLMIIRPWTRYMVFDNLSDFLDAVFDTDIDPDETNSYIIEASMKPPRYR